MCVELLLMYQIPHGEVHILHIYICVHTPHVRDTGRSPHGAGPGATDLIGMLFMVNNNYIKKLHVMQ